MKPLKILLVLGGIILLASCKKEELGVDEYRIGNLYTVSDQLSFRIEGVNDSRCPKGAACIWQGDAWVYLKIYYSGIQKDTLCFLGNCSSQAVAGPYSFKLEDVSPYPEIGVAVDDDDMIIKMLITKE